MTTTSSPDAITRPGIHLAETGRVATITFDRPEKKNALDPDAWTLLDDLLHRVRASDARVLVLTGANGDFCAGADTSVPRPRDVHPLDRMQQITAPLVTLHEMPIPVVARVDGVAVGAGWSLALCADLIVATRRARFSQIFARRGLSVDCGSSWLLTHAVGLHTAKRLVYLADMISAQEAADLGLVTHLAAEDDLDSMVDDLTSRLAAAPPIALRLDKHMLNHVAGRTFREAIEAENAAQAINFATDAPTARAAIVAGETPEFTGGWKL